MHIYYDPSSNLTRVQEPETEDDQTLPPNAFAQALIDAGNEEDTFSRPIPPSTQLVAPIPTDLRLSPVVEVSYQAEQVVEPSEPKPSIEPPGVLHPNVRPFTPEPEPRREEVAADEPMNGAPLSPPESPMIMSPELPPKKSLPTPPDDEVQGIGEQHPPPMTAPTKSAEDPAINDVFKSPPPQPEHSTHPSPLRTLRTAENPDLNAKTAPLPTPTPNIFAPLPPPTDIPGTRLMRKASAPQLQPNAPTFVRDPVPRSTLALPKRTSWLTKAREEAKALTHAKRTEPYPGLSDPPTVTANHLTKSTKRKPSEIFDGVEIPPRHSGKVQKVTETDVQTNATKEQHGGENREEREEEQESEQERDIRKETYSDVDLDEEDPLHTLKRTVEGLGSRAGKSMGKSIGGLAAAALAEARATAEARIAEKTEKFAAIEPRPKQPETRPQQLEDKDVEQTNSDSQQQLQKEKSPVHQPTNARVSLHNKERVFQPPSQADVIKLKAHKGDTNKSNDLAQPTRSILKPPPVHQPVFSKPVFTAPKPKPTSSKPPTVTNVGLQPSFSSTSNNKLDDAPAPTAWLLENQESRDRDNHNDHTAFSTALYDTRNDLGGHGSDLDEGDSWHDGDKLNPIWSALNFDGAQRDDEMTWSTIPTQNHTSSTQGLHTTHTGSSTSTGYKSTKSKEEKEKESLEILGLTNPDVPPSPPKEDKVLEKVQEPPGHISRENGDNLVEMDDVEDPTRAPGKVGIISPFPSTRENLTNGVIVHGGTFNLSRRTAFQCFQDRRRRVWSRQEGKNSRTSEGLAVGHFISQKGVSWPVS